MSTDRITARDRNPHWLVFNDRRHVTGCECGFRADIAADGGYGASVVDHIAQVVRDEATPKLYDVPVPRTYNFYPGVGW